MTALRKVDVSAGRRPDKSRCVARMGRKNMKTSSEFEPHKSLELPESKEMVTLQTLVEQLFPEFVEPTFEKSKSSVALFLSLAK